MKTSNLSIRFLLPFLLLIAGCETETVPTNASSNTGGNSVGSSGADWLIPVDQVYDGGPGKDGIPALENPVKLELDHSSNNYLSNEDLVLGIKSGNVICAYPHPILDWHEIINDQVGGQAVAVTYCPLTGTGVAWGRMINNKETTFGVSGLLYNSNLLPYDRLTGSNWSQIGLVCVNGQLISSTPEILSLIEMPWGKWKELFPESRVVSTSTGYSRSYGRYPYNDYRTSSWLIFPANPTDDRLHEKERVLGIIKNDKLRVYRFNSFGTTMGVILDEFEGEMIAVAGLRDQYMVAFSTQMEDGVIMNLEASGAEGMLTDQEGNLWNLFGEAVSGPRKDQQLPLVTAFMGYWFSFAAFYPDPEIYN